MNYIDLSIDWRIEIYLFDIYTIAYKSSVTLCDMSCLRPR